METLKSSEYEQGFKDAFDVIADYVEKEVCLVTAEMIRRIKTETWRFNAVTDSSQSDTLSSDTHPLEEPSQS